MVTTTRDPLYLCLCGLSGAGKDTAGDHLERAHGFHRVAIADPLKRHVQQLFGLSNDQLWGEQRNTPDARLGRTPRELYQVFGDMCRSLDPEIWIRLWCAAVCTALADGHSVVCTDLRTLPELQAARSRGARVWRIVRPGAGAPGRAGEHGTERALAELADDQFDRCIRNDGDRPAPPHHRVGPRRRGPRVTRRADADPISLASLPHRNMVRRARDILHRIAAGEPYVRFHGKRLRHDRTRISVPLGRHYRLIFHDDGAHLRPIACMSHSAYNGAKPGARRH